MTEDKVKRRDWVKNAAIIFLAVMLVLTFFSNTIMNRSLPEVSAQYTQSGSITTRIRGTGTVEATETYEVQIADSRKVKSVMVRVGDEVAPGDVLFLLAEGDSDELEAARETLESLQYNYQKALISAGEVDENGETREIVRAREKLQQAINDRDKNAGVSDAAVEAAKLEYDEAVETHRKAEEKLEAAGGESSGSSGDYSLVTAAQNALNAAKIAYDAAKIQYQTEYDLLKLIAEYERSLPGNNGYSLDAYMEYLGAKYENEGDKATTSSASSITSAHLSGTVTAVNEADQGKQIEIEFEGTVPSLTYSKYSLTTAYSALNDAKSAHQSAQDAYNRAVDAYYDSYSPDNSALAKKVRDAKIAMDNAKAEYDELVAKQTAYETAKDAVISAQDTLEGLIIQQKLDNLEFQQMRNQIAKAQAEVSELSGASGSGGEIVSEVYGVVKSIGVSAGGTTDPKTTLAAIEVPDRGYSVKLAVTLEQSRKVQVGDTAEISTGYWGGSGLSGRLVGIAPDPDNPSSSRLLVFDITGDVSSGTSVTVSIGQKSQNYDVIVPNSAVREDSNGKYVLAVIAKSSPLGNRYIATRIDVQVLATDDTNSAVSGGLSSWEYVITNSTKPVENGMQVRMADNA